MNAELKYLIPQLKDESNRGAQAMMLSLMGRKKNIKNLQSICLLKIALK